MFKAPKNRVVLSNKNDKSLKFSLNIKTVKIQKLIMKNQ